MGSVEHTLKISWSTSLAYNKFRGVNKNIMNSYQNNSKAYYFCLHKQLELFCDYKNVLHIFSMCVLKLPACFKLRTRIHTLAFAHVGPVLKISAFEPV